MTVSSEQTDERITRATRKQQDASNPFVPVWVSASAGTGKTKVLSDRYLRLLLPSPLENGKHASGARPEKILCITFTKAAAAEMENRVRKRLSDWAVIDKKELEKSLTDLTGTTPTDYQICEARRLFARTVDASGGLMIMTIHSFCQSVLARFPIEAGIPPNFSVIDERETKEYLQTARRNCISRLMSHSETKPEITDMIARFGTATFSGITNSMIGKRMSLNTAIKEYGSIEGLIAELRRTFGVEMHDTPESIIADFRKNTNTDAVKQLIADIESFAGKKGNEKIPMAVQWIGEEHPSFEQYKKAFLTAENTLNSQIATKDFRNNAPDSNIFLEHEADRIIRTLHRLSAAEIVRMTSQLLSFFVTVEKEFTRLKSLKSALDFDDQISLTARLLSDETMCGWVMYKLDGGIDHILVDEAQDTNPDQWKIINALTTEMTSGKTRYDDNEDFTKRPRTLFVVGDEKQSIYSFQNADPREFARMRDVFKQRFAACGLPVNEIAMNISFRSVQAVLDGVNAVFGQPAARQGLTIRPDDDIIHESSRSGQAGRIELLPYITEEYNNGKNKQFRLPLSPVATDNAEETLARTLAKTITSMINSGHIIASRNRPVTPGDILVLVTTRTHFVVPFVKALKEAKIPVSGVDRIILSQELPVQDMMTLCSFILLPEDDLTLAELLKSPLFNRSEDDLFDLCTKRGEQSLWEYMTSRDDYADITEYLKKLIRRAGNITPFEFLTHVLESPCPADSRSGRRAFIKRLGEPAIEPLEMLLIEALTFEHGHTPSLQEFHYILTSGDTQIKPQSDAEGFKAVRIMTVHGAKGLQAPIVFLPDTFKTSVLGKDEYKEFDMFENGLPFYSNKNTNIHPLVAQVTENKKQRAVGEYRRLLYVAMTRAEDELYITGMQKLKANGEGSAIDESWYNIIRDGLKTIAETRPITDNNWEDIPLSEKSVLVYERKGNKLFDEKASAAKRTVEITDLESDAPWLYIPVGNEDRSLKPLRPSKTYADDTAVASPLKSANKFDVFKMGTIIHHLLQVLPELPEDKREIAARNYLSDPAHDISSARQEETRNEVSAVLNHQTFAGIFSPRSRAEVSVTGVIANRYVVSGQIDRLCETEDEVMIVDYKTNRPPPDDISGIPEQYAKQLSGYRAVLQSVYPHKKVRCALLWTYTCKMMEVPEDMLDTAFRKLIEQKPA